VNLLFVGQLRYYKGLNYLIEALPGIPNANLTVVGTGPMEQAWKTLAEQCRVAARVHWAGQVSDADLPAYYAACDIFVLPCSERSEAFGAVQLEAMASARPVVSCDVNTGVAWVNQTGVTGVVVPPKDPAALAEALTTLAGDPARRQQMGEAGRARVQQEFTIERMTDQVMTIYAGVLALPGRAG
jgi:rhamnosyl/mannosyltransferase